MAGMGWPRWPKLGWLSGRWRLLSAVISCLGEGESGRGDMAEAVGALIGGVRHRREGRGDHARGRALPRPVRARLA
jgi:hypothetical protein